MRTSAETTNGLYADYARQAAVDLGGLLRLLASLEQEPGNRQALTELMTGFHGFAGAGGTFGFPEHSATGAAGERLTLRLLAAQAPLLPAERQELASLVAALERQLSAPGGAAATPDPAGEPADERPRGSVLVAAAAATQRSLVPLLRLGGFAVRVACGEAEALAEIAAALPDVLVAEAELPEGSGYQLTAMLRQLPRGDQPAVLLLGPADGHCDHSTAIFCGADAALDRPLDWTDLARHLSQLHAGRADAARVLAVEDDPRHAAYVREVLEAEGYEVSVCADPHLFGAALATLRPHLVLMDVLLPGISGYELVRTLRGNEFHAGLPVLFLTTEGQIGARIESVRAGGDDHLVKPVPAPLLVSAVAARIERSRSLQQRLERDGLTRLLNQTAFLDRARALAAAPDEGSQRRQAVWVMIDLDHFKTINDRFGHPAGDRVLTAVAAFLRRHVRARDVVGRYGGEELALLFSGLPSGDAVRLVDRLRREFGELEFAVPEGPAFKVTWSAGVAALRPGMSWEDWREAADQALYAAKRGGRNRVELAVEPEEPLPAARRVAAAGSAQPAAMGYLAAGAALPVAIEGLRVAS